MPTGIKIYDIRSEEIQEIIGTPPSWLVRYGVWLWAVVLTALFGVAAWVEYPDVVSADIQLTTLNPPVRLLPKTAGRIQFLVADSQQVSTNRALAYIANTADWDAIQALGVLLQHPQKTDLPQLALGELQPAYQAYKQAIREAEIFAELGSPASSVAHLQTKINTQHAVNDNFHDQFALMQQEFDLSKRRYKADSMLSKGKYIAEYDFFATANTFIQQQRGLKNAESTLLGNEAQINELRQQIQTLDIDYRKRAYEVLLNKEKAYQTLRTEYEKWTDRYVILTPIAGRVSYLQYWRNNQYIESNVPLLAVIPTENTYIGKISLPVEGVGKVQLGQRVVIRLANYPAQEYGMLHGAVVQISTVGITPQSANQAKTYIATVRLTQGLRTDYHKKLPAQPELEGKAEVITKEKTVLARLFPFWYLVL